MNIQHTADISPAEWPQYKTDLGIEKSFRSATFPAESE
jgi:hypothetical protein